MSSRRPDCPFAHKELENTPHSIVGADDLRVSPSIVVETPTTYQCRVCGTRFLEGAIPECKEMEAGA